MHVRAGALATAVLAAVGGLLPGCGAATRDSRLDAQAEAYVRIVLALGERDRDSLDFYAGPPEWQREVRAANAPLPAVRQSALDLRAAIARDDGSETPDGGRRRFLLRQLDAVVARVDVLAGAGWSFARESRELFGVDVPPLPPSADLVGIRGELDRRLPGVGPLGRRFAEYERRFVVAPSRLDAVMTRALELCRRATRAQISLPDGEGVRVEYGARMPWSAFTTYEGRAQSRIRVRAGVGLTVDGALQLACHEAYPGHHTIDTLIDATFPDRVELSVVPLFSPFAFATEAAASYAPALAFTPDERLRVERDELFPLAGIDPALAADSLATARLVEALRPVEGAIAQRFVDGDLEFARAAAALEDEALVPSADATLKFLNEFRSYGVTYTLGRDRVASAIEAAGAGGGPDDRWRAYQAWILGAIDGPKATSAVDLKAHRP